MRRISSSINVRVQALQENRYLSGLDEKFLSRLAENTRLIAFDADESIILEGLPCQGLNIVESGRVKIYKYSSSGREMIINVLEQGGIF